jgi:hypothetical protein
MDAAYRSAEQTLGVGSVEEWRGDTEADTGGVLREYDDSHYLIKEEKMADGRMKVIPGETSGQVVQKVV